MSGFTRSAVAVADAVPAPAEPAVRCPDWAALAAMFRALIQDRDHDVYVPERWNAFVSACAATDGRPPYHLRSIVETAEALADGRPRSSLKGIDHGCGTGLNVLYLHALGFTGIRGINVVPACLKWNGWLREHVGYGDDVFVLYDGRRLPAADASQDLVLSQQVVEHISPPLLEAYYREEGRVLREGGLAVHQAPHRLSPYDSHTRTWLVHWLPRALQMPVYRWLGCNADWVRADLFLRMPGRHRRLVRGSIGPMRDLTRERVTRLAASDVADYYDGPTRLRLLLSLLGKLPVAGSLLARMIAPFLMSETVATRRADAVTAARPRRRAIFLLSEVVIDFDTYLPIAMALKRTRPEFDIRFVTFGAENYRFILANPTLVAGLERCGTLTLLDRSASNRIARRLNTLGGLTRIAAWLAARPGSVLFHGRQFAEAPFAVLYLLNRVLGGRGVLLARSRQPDSGIKTNIRPRFEAHAKLGEPSLVARLFGRDHDALVHYHDVQALYLNSLSQFGRVDLADAVCMGLPNLLPDWQALVRSEVARARRELAGEGFDADEVYAIFAPKSFSSKFLRLPDSGERSFRLAVEALKTLRPRATVLVRPHPRAVNEPWLTEAVRAAAHPHLKLTLLHPEVLCALASRTIAPNNTTTMLIAAEGRYIDCTDYAPDHYQIMGERSLCDGYNCVFVNPANADFMSRFEAALDDAAFAGAALDPERRALLERNPPRLDLLVDVIEGARP